MIGGPDERPRQLPFPLSLAPSFRREDFVVGASNGAAWALIERWPDWPHRVALIVGGEGTGKRHLARIWGARAGARIVSARALREREPVSRDQAGGRGA